MEPRTHLRAAGALLAVTSAIGVLIALVDDLASLGTALTSGTYLNAPGPILTVQLVSLVLAVRGSRAANVVLLLATTVSLAAAAFDGDVGHDGLTTLELAQQAVLVAAYLWVWVAAAGTLARSRVRRAPA